MKTKLFPILYSLLLIGFTAFVLLDFFVIERVYEVVDETPSSSLSSTDEQNVSSGEKESHVEPIITANSYEDENINIKLSEHRVGETTVYVADVLIKTPSYFKTAFAKDVYGKNIKEKTSLIAQNKGAILAVNGDYYSARKGCVIRNGAVYRAFSGDEDEESLVINADGSFSFEMGNTGNAEALVNNGAVQVLTFGPALITEGVISVGTDDEVDKAMRDNPRTAIAWYGDLHYAFIVADGRTNESKGLSLYELAQFAKSLGVKQAYNLDGGGSSTMYFNGKIVNNPTTNGKKISEREVSDIVYIGY